ncbi:egl nine homolog 1-like [Amia ocellicauda]|uniref:egl nine homolog 1-like n=1 Tax=Amia ocellicauda TaxID=2972642 RepID=UPI0034644087
MIDSPGLRGQKHGHQLSPARAAESACTSPVARGRAAGRVAVAGGRWAEPVWQLPHGTVPHQSRHCPAPVPTLSRTSPTLSRTSPTLSRTSPTLSRTSPTLSRHSAAMAASLQDGSARHGTGEAADSTQPVLKKQPLGREAGPVRGREDPASTCTDGSSTAAPEPRLPPNRARGGRGAQHREQRRPSAQRLVSQYIVPSMTAYGLCRVDHFLGNRVGERVLQEVLNLHQGGKLQDGQLASRKLGRSKSIRGDQIAWVEGTEPGCENIGFLLTRMDKLITYADGKLGNFKIRGRHKVGEHGIPVCATGY